MRKKIIVPFIITLPLLLIAAIVTFAEDERPLPAPVMPMPMMETAVIPDQRAPETLVRYVDPTAGGAGNGISWGDAYTSLQTALADSSSGTHLWLAEGTYKPGTLLTDTFQLVNGVSLFGGFPAGGGDGTFNARFPEAHVTTLSGDIGVLGDTSDNSLHVVKGSNITSEVILDGIVIANGNASLTWPDNVGAGLFLDNAIVTLRTCRVINHTSSEGTPALRAQNNSLLKIDYCLFAYSTALAGAGSAMIIVDSDVEIINSGFNYHDINNDFIGPLWLQNSNLILANTIFANNTDSGTIYLEGGSKADINHVSMNGGNVALRVRAGTAVTVTNSIFWGNGPTEILNIEGGTATVSDSIVEGGFGGGTNILNSDPDFVDTVNSDLRLQTGSPAADSADAATCAATDLLGYPRPLGSGCDMGAHETPSMVKLCSTPLTPIAIPDNDPAGITNTIDSASFPASGVILDVDVVLTVTHEWVGDLSATVQHNSSGQAATILDRPGFPVPSNFGCEGNNIAATLDDQAFAPVEHQCAPATPTIDGSFVPNEPLATLNGESLVQGNPAYLWHLNIKDHEQDFSGALVDWCIDVDYKPALVVTRLDDPVPDGCNLGDCSLREAIITANGAPLADTIIFDVTGTITLTQAGPEEEFAATGDLDIRDDLMLVGRGTDKTIVDGGALDRVFQIFNPATVTISDLTVQNGLIAPGDGAGGGGIFNSSFSLVQLQRLILQNNHALEGGIAGAGGALIAGWGTNTKIIDCALYNNSANFYSAILHQDGHMQLINSTVYANSGSTLGAVMHVATSRNATLDLQNSTITQNGDPFALNVDADNGQISTINMQNSIIDGPTSCNFSGAGGTTILNSLGHNIARDGTCNLVAAGDMPNTDPLLDVLSNNGGNTLTAALLPGSPAIDAGNDAACPERDQRGIRRINRDGNFDGGSDNNPCDIGAFERLPMQLDIALLTPTSIRLTWNNSGHDSHQLWRSFTPFSDTHFLSSQDDLIEEMLINPTQSKYFEVYGVFGSNTAERSNRVGVFGFLITPGS